MVYGKIENPNQESMGRKKQRKISIPNDIIFGMLSKLPAKSLVRFKTVCKLWNCFISDLKYDNHVLIFSSSSSIQSVFFEESGIKLVQLELPVKNPLFFKVVGSSDGLLCVSVMNESILWNPWTGRYKTVPISDYFHQFGLGYDQSTNDYKIVRLYHLPFEIYSVNSDSREKGTLPWIIEFDEIHWGTFGTSVNGGIHWPIIFIHTTLDKQCSCILRLDLTNQKFSQIQLPYDIGKKPKYELLDFSGRLCVVHYLDAGHIDIWIMENLEKQNWVKLMSIPRLEELHPDDYLSPDFITENGEVLMNIRRKYPNRQRTNGFCLYNPKEKTFKHYEIEASKRFYQVVTYTQSLISPVQFLSAYEEERFMQEGGMLLLQLQALFGAAT